MTGKAVLDTSAVLALCFAERGAKAALARGKDGILSAVSYSEAIAKCLDHGVPFETVTRALAGLKLAIIPFDEEHALAAASFRPATRTLNVSFADRACLGTAALAKLPVLTADRKWDKIKCDLEIIFIR
jgi:PIN domain nuclease of toxin-antitoxin system